VILLYSATLFLSAALLFLVEPMVGKLLLPVLGGAPAVWITTLLFFQAALLAGYAYGHLAARWLSIRRQTLLHLALLVLAGVALPFGAPGGAPPAGSANPVLWLLGALVVLIGLPFFVVGASGPLLQAWLARTRHRAARDPYFLFAASNAGSILGLLAYPALLEPRLSLHAQERLWAIAYAGLVALVGACALSAWRAREPRAVEAPDAPEQGQPAPPLTGARRARWLALAFVPSSLMLGVTTYITRDLAPVPLLWVLPLGLYLASFVVAFAPGARPARIVALTRIALPGVVILVVYTIAVGSERPLWFLLPLHLTGLAVAALMGHSALAADRPPARHLTEFYLWVALGGVLGGIFNALLAPLVFSSLVEYPLTIVAACLLRPAAPRARPALLEALTGDKRPSRALDFAVPVLFGVAVAFALHTAQGAGASPHLEQRTAAIGLAAGLSVNLARRPVRFALAVGALLLAATAVAGQPGRALAHERTFFGIYRVRADAGYHELFDGTTLHGLQRMNGAQPPEPVGYYERAGPVGQVFASSPRADSTRSVGVIGLGTGALACYSRPGERWTFYEIDPAVARIARDQRLFTYLRDCRGRFAVVLGDARRSLAASSGRYGTLVLDAFSSDAIPIHLVTREALALYLAHLLPHGRLLFHVSNRYLDLPPVLGRLAASARLACRVERASTGEGEHAGRVAGASTWVLMGRRPEDLGRLSSDPRWQACPVPARTRAWSDDYSSVITALK